MTGDRLKCIGGVLDGTYVTLERSRAEYSFHEREKLKPAVVMEKMDAEMTFNTTRHTYTRRKMPFSARAGGMLSEWDTIEYLAPIEWTDFQAVKHQFDK